MNDEKKDLYKFVRIKRVKLINFKNVKKGEINLECKNSEKSTQNIIGIYGQNGSGKSAFVEAMGVIASLLRGISLEDNIIDYIYFNENYCVIEIEFEIFIKNTEDKYYVTYNVQITKLQNENILASKELKKPNVILNETLKYKTMEKGSKNKIILGIDYEKDTIIPNAMKQDLSFDSKNEILLYVAKKISIDQRKSFVFSNEVFEVISNFFKVENNKTLINAEKIICMDLLKQYSYRGLNIVDEKEIQLGIQIPLVFEFKDKNLIVGQQYKHIKDILDKQIKKNELIIIKNAYKQINNILETIIPNLNIEIKELNTLTNKEGDEFVEIEIYTKREKLSIPLKYESQGIRKIISLLSFLVYAYNNEGVCVVIDELDSAIFEYLLGELLIVFKENAKGQLIFTSHNLRALEVLESNSVVFTTTNPENRYIKFKNVKRDNNLRDMYYTAIQLGGQDEEVYKANKTHVIRRAFKKAGEIND